MWRTRRRVLALAAALCLALPGCLEFDQIYPWNWHASVKVKKPIDQLPGKANVEEEKRRAAQEELRARSRLPVAPPPKVPPPVSADSLEPDLGPTR